MSEKKQKFEVEFVVQMVLIVILSGVLMFSLGKVSAGGSGGIGFGIVSASEVIPTGTPSIYGKELSIKYDDVSPNDPRLADDTIEVLSKVDRSVTLQGAELQRYIDILIQISCEYCCGAESIIFEDGRAACGCAHSYAMRGLAKYLIQNHGDEFTDDEILAEVGKWKVLFFPGIHETKAEVLKQDGIEPNYINLASNKYRGIEQGQSASSSGMVGGC